MPEVPEILQVHVTLADKEPQVSALINTIPPRSSKTFDDYAREYILPKIVPKNAYGAKYERVDIVFRVYKKLNLV